MRYVKPLLLLTCVALSLPGCATRLRLSTEQRSERPMLPTPPADLLLGERSPPPLDSSGAAYVEAYGASQRALERANVKLAGWATLWRCTAAALAKGEAPTKCNISDAWGAAAPANQRDDR